MQPTPSPHYKYDDEDNSYVPYVSVAQRRQQKLAKYGSFGASNARQKRQEEIDEREDTQREEEQMREKARMERTLLMEAQEVHMKKAAEGAPTEDRCTIVLNSLPRLQENGIRKGRGS